MLFGDVVEVAFEIDAVPLGVVLESFEVTPLGPFDLTVLAGGGEILLAGEVFGDGGEVFGNGGELFVSLTFPPTLLMAGDVAALGLEFLAVLLDIILEAFDMAPLGDFDRAVRAGDVDLCVEKPVFGDRDELFLSLPPPLAALVVGDVVDLVLVVASGVFFCVVSLDFVAILLGVALESLVVSPLDACDSGSSELIVMIPPIAFFTFRIEFISSDGLPLQGEVSQFLK